MTAQQKAYEQEYLGRVMTLLTEHKATGKLKAEVKHQILEHIEECRQSGEDFQLALGSPEDLAFEYLGLEHAVDKRGGTSSQGQTVSKRQPMSMSILIGFLVLTFVYYTVSQATAALFLTTSLVPGGLTSNISVDPNFSFNLWFRISDMPWYNLSLIVMSACIAIGLAFITIFMIRKGRGRSNVSV